MSKSHYFDDRTINAILPLLKEKKNIRDIYNKVHEAGLFKRGESTFRNIFKTYFRENPKNGEYIYVHYPNVGLWETHPDVMNGIFETPKSNVSDNNSDLSSEEPMSSCYNNDPTSEGKDLFINKLSEKNNISSTSNDIKKESNSSLPKDTDENIKAIIFKLNQLEQKVNKKDKFITQIVEDRNKMHSLSKSIINSVAEVLNEKK